MKQSPTPTVFNVFTLPKDQRLPALREALVAGADLNCADPRLNRYESLLGRACRPCVGGEIDQSLIQELLDQGANPLRGTTWCPEVGEMQAVFNRCALLAMDYDPSDVASSSDVADSGVSPLIIRAMLKACLFHDHRDDGGRNAFASILRDLHPFSNAHLADPIRQALEVGFSVNQEFDHDRNAIQELMCRNRMTKELSANNGQWAWQFIDDLIDAGIDMDHRDDKDFSVWEMIDECAPYVGGVVAFARIQAKRKSRELDEQTPGVSLAASTRRM